MNEVTLLHDLAIVMIAAGIAAFLAHMFDQSKVLGYILAGIAIGPHTPRFRLCKARRRSRPWPIWVSCF